MKKLTMLEKRIKKEVENDVNNIKLGHFQLQTKSFWLALVSLLCIFLLLSFYLNVKLMNDVMKHEETMIKIMNDHYDHNNDLILRLSSSDIVGDESINRSK